MRSAAMDVTSRSTCTQHASVTFALQQSLSFKDASGSHRVLLLFCMHDALQSTCAFAGPFPEIYCMRPAAHCDKHQQKEPMKAWNLIAEIDPEHFKCSNSFRHLCCCPIALS